MKYLIIICLCVATSGTSCNQERKGSSVKVLASNNGNDDATCSPSGDCNACKNCKYCKHCSKDGGTCSVCK